MYLNCLSFRYTLTYLHLLGAVRRAAGEPSAVHALMFIVFAWKLLESTSSTDLQKKRVIIINALVTGTNIVMFLRLVSILLLSLIVWQIKYDVPKCVHANPPKPTIDLSQLQKAILSLAPDISKHLSSHGYYTTTSLLPMESIIILHSQAVTLREEGHYIPSHSEIHHGNKVQRVDKKGVYHAEPIDGRHYNSAPDLITYIVS